MPAIHGVVCWRVIDLVQWLSDEFQVVVAKQTLSRELRHMGYRRLSPGRAIMLRRAAPSRLLNVWPAPSASDLLRPGLISLRQRIRSQGHSPGQDGDPRVPVLISLTVSSAIF